MGYIRFGFTALMVTIEFIISLPFMLITYLIGFISMKARDRITLAIVHISFKSVLFFAGAKLHVTGLENIPKEEPVLYIGNHKSFFDVITVYTLFPKMTCFIAKKEFKKVPIMSLWMMMLHNLFLDRDDIKQGLKVILQAIEYVKSGMSVCIFPEGTRNKTQEDMLPFHEGSFKIATKTNCAIIPTTMYNMSAVFEDHFPKLIRSDVYIDFGKPIYPDALEAEQKKHIGSYVRGIMLGKYIEMKEMYTK